MSVVNDFWLLRYLLQFHILTYILGKALCWELRYLRRDLAIYLSFYILTCTQYFIYWGNLWKKQKKNLFNNLVYIREIVIVMRKTVLIFQIWFYLFRPSFVPTEFVFSFYSFNVWHVQLFSILSSLFIFICHFIVENVRLL